MSSVIDGMFHVSRFTFYEMVFSSIIFLFYYLPIVLGIYYLIIFFSPRSRGQTGSTRIINLFLLFASLFFYIWGERLLVLVMLTSCVIDYISAILIQRQHDLEQSGEPPAARFSSCTKKKTWLTMSIATNLALLGFFKYFGFFTETVALTGVVSDSLGAFASKIVLPLGISFYTFQSMSYTIDVYYGKVQATRSFKDFCCFVTLFPQLIAGPIVRYRDVDEQLVTRRFSLEKFSIGIQRFILGLGKKVLIANTVATAADEIFALPVEHVPVSVAWLGIVCYTIQIYFDFSGYSDMAIGLGYMLGFKFPENFNYPYIAASIQDFWRRWHISLSTWFRDYLYIPLGGNKISPQRTFFNLITVFILCGLWHGASWNFVAWGAYHGVFLVFERIVGQSKIQQWPRFLRHLYVLFVVMIGWVVFRTETLGYAGSYLIRLLGIQSPEAVLYSPQQFLQPDVLLMLLLSFAASMPLYRWLKNIHDDLLDKTQSRSIEICVFTVSYSFFAVIALLSTMNLASGTYNPFIYFRF